MTRNTDGDGMVGVPNKNRNGTIMILVMVAKNTNVLVFLKILFEKYESSIHARACNIGGRKAIRTNNI